MRDADVAGIADNLGLPGLFDVHVHFMPPQILRKVWAYFDAAGPKIGRPWPITYRGTDDERVGQLRSMDVKRFSALSYAHKPGIAGTTGRGPSRPINPTACGPERFILSRRPRRMFRS